MAGKRHLQYFNRRRVLRERELQGLTLRDLAERCEQAGERINHTTLSRWEAGIFGPTIPRVHVLARALNINVDELLTPPDETRLESAR